MATTDELRDLCERWADSWTGNKPEELIRFYSDDAFYSDPAVRDGLKGHKEMLPYFKKLLAANPQWIWKVLEIIPSDKGLVLKWEATIPVGDQVVREQGLDILEFEDFEITRNEVYFDRARLLHAMNMAK